MTDMMNFKPLPIAEEAEDFAPTIRPRIPQPVRHAPIGRVVEVGGGGGRLELEASRVADVARDPDPSVALSGQVGGHVKLEAGQPLAARQRPHPQAARRRGRDGLGRDRLPRRRRGGSAVAAS
jgi:hypothetical protein